MSDSLRKVIIKSHRLLANDSYFTRDWWFASTAIPYVIRVIVHSVEEFGS